MSYRLLRNRIHIFGASGAGATTLGQAVAKTAGLRHLDVDDYYWTPTELPYRVERERIERIRLLSEALDEARTGWVLTGSLCGWGDELIAQMQLAVFLALPQRLRLLRLRERELQRFGADRLGPGGDMEEHHEVFMAWAAQYDEGGSDVRSRQLHESWIGLLCCPVIRLDSSASVDELVAAVIGAAS